MVCRNAHTEVDCTIRTARPARSLLRVSAAPPFTYSNGHAVAYLRRMSIHVICAHRYLHTNSTYGHRQIDYTERVLLKCVVGVGLVIRAIERQHTTRLVSQHILPHHTSSVMRRERVRKIASAPHKHIEHTRGECCLGCERAETAPSTAGTGHR